MRPQRPARSCSPSGSPARPSRPAAGTSTSRDASPQTAAANNVDVDAAYYTDICGIPLKADGTAAINVDRTEDLASALTGRQRLAHPAGRHGNGRRTARTGRRSRSPASWSSAARTSPPTSRARSASSRSGSTRAPPRSPATCRATATRPRATTARSCRSRCPSTRSRATATTARSTRAWPGSSTSSTSSRSAQSSPGNVGWLDWDPPAGGVERARVLDPHPRQPGDQPAVVAVRQRPPATSNGGGGPCSMSDRGRDPHVRGQVVLAPQFDLTCNHRQRHRPGQHVSRPSSPPRTTAARRAHLGGNGQNQWYRMPSFAFLQLCGPTRRRLRRPPRRLHPGQQQRRRATPAAARRRASSASSCNIMGTGTVGAGVGSGTGNKAIGVQLIK